MNFTIVPVQRAPGVSRSPGTTRSPSTYRLTGAEGDVEPLRDGHRPVPLRAGPGRGRGWWPLSGALSRPINTLVGLGSIMLNVQVSGTTEGQQGNPPAHLFHGHLEAEAFRSLSPSPGPQKHSGPKAPEGLRLPPGGVGGGLVPSHIFLNHNESGFEF